MKITLQSLPFFILFLIGCSEHRFDFSQYTDQADGKLVGVMGVGPIIPAVSDYDEYQEKIEVFFVPGTSDAIESYAHAAYNDAAYEWAKAHNEALLAKIDSEQIR